MKTANGKHVTAIGSTWAPRYTYGDRVCCELRRVWPNRDIDLAVAATGWGETEAAALGDAVADLERTARERSI